MRLSEVLNEVAANTLRYRRFEHTVNGEQFRNLFVLAPEEDKVRLLAVVESGSEILLKEWMDRIRRRDYGRMTARELRKLASARSIEDYNLLRKDEIVDELRKLDRMAECAITTRADDFPSSGGGDSAIKLGLHHGDGTTSGSDRLVAQNINPVKGD